VSIHIRAGIERNEIERCLGVSGVLSRGWNDIFIFLYYVDVEFHVVAKDWMLPEKDEVIGGKTYKVHNKNPKYENDKIFTFIFPQPRRK